MKTIVIIQARMGSTRLPGKVLKPLGNTDVLTYVVTRCKEIKGVEDIIVATSELAQDDELVKWCNVNQVSHFRGSETNVLDRYIKCAKFFQADYVMRVTSDCPFVDYEMASEMISIMQLEQKDIVSIEEKLPRGVAVELISLDALLRIEQATLEPRHLEHVTYYAYEFKEKFTRAIYHPSRELLYPEFRITLDTEDDYVLLSSIAKRFNNLCVPCGDIIKYLSQNPDIASINSHVEQKPVI